MRTSYSMRPSEPTVGKTRLISLSGRRSLFVGSLGLVVGFLTIGCGKPFKSTQRISLTAELPSQRLRIAGTIGDIMVRAEPGAKSVEATITKVTHGTSQARADEALDEIQISFEAEDKEGTTVVGKSRHPRNSATASYVVRWEVTAPPGLPLDIEASVGDVRVEGCTGAVRVAGGIGDVIVLGAKDPAAGLGPVTITNDVGDVRVDRVTEPLYASTSIGGIRASAAGKVSLKTSVGDVRLRLLQGSSEGVEIRTSVGDVHVSVPEGWKGKVVADADIGSTSIHLGSSSMESVRHHRSRFTAEIGDAVEPVLQAMTDVGDVFLRSYVP